MAGLQTGSKIAALFIGAGVMATAQPSQDLVALATPIRTDLAVTPHRSRAKPILPKETFVRAGLQDAAAVPGATLLNVPANLAMDPRSGGAEAVALIPPPVSIPRSVSRSSIVSTVSTASAAITVSQPPEVSLDQSTTSGQPDYPPDASLAASIPAPTELSMSAVGDGPPAALAGFSGKAAPVSGAVERLKALFPTDQAAQPRGGTFSPRAISPAKMPESETGPALKQEILSRMASPAPNVHKPRADTATKLAGGAIRQYQQTAQGLSFAVAARLNGTDVGSVSLLIRDGENISVRLGDLLAALKPAMGPALYERFSTSRAAGDYMTFNELRAAGISVQFDDGDNLLLGSR